MSGIGFGELIILFLIGLIVLGPERLPRVANQLGNWLGQARRMTRAMKRQLEDELALNKPFDIVPPARTQHASQNDFGLPAPGMAAPTKPEKDDTWSAAHDADSPGTGVNDEPSEAAATSTEPADGNEKVEGDHPEKDPT